MCVNKFSLAGKSALVVCPENNWGPEVVQGLKAAGCKVFLAGPNKEAMEAMGVTEFLTSEITYVASNEIEVADEETKEKVYNLIDALEEIDDVQNVYHNLEM